jgi:hypothetical protein
VISPTTDIYLVETGAGEVHCSLSNRFEYKNLNYHSRGSFSLPTADIRGIIVDSLANTALVKNS